MLKTRLCTGPILAYPQFDRPFILQTDTSDTGVGAVLTQHDPLGHEHVISYDCWSLSDREKAYSATEREALVVVFAPNHFHAYLLGKKFTIVTDHSALHWLHSVVPKGRLARCVMELQEYSFDIQHRPSTENGNADALSRLPTASSINKTKKRDLQKMGILEPICLCIIHGFMSEILVLFSRYLCSSLPINCLLNCIELFPNF